MQTQRRVYIHVCGCVNVDTGTKFDMDVDVDTEVDTETDVHADEQL